VGEARKIYLFFPRKKNENEKGKIKMRNSATTKIFFFLLV
jgi:hypothetical protein